MWLNRLRFILFPVILLLIYLYMHYCIGGCNFSYQRFWDYTQIVNLLFKCFIDVTGTILISFCLFFWNKRIMLGFAYLLAFVLCISNVIYGRFFGVFMSFDAWKEFFSRIGSNLYSQYAGSIFQLSDIWLILLAVLACFSIYKITFSFKKLFIGIACVFVLNGIWWTIDAYVRCSSLPDFNTDRFSKFQIARHPNSIFDNYGLITSYCTMIFVDESYNLSSAEKEEITDYLSAADARNEEFSSMYYGIDRGKNLVFILVESYLSLTSDLLVNGKEITPYLNQLRHLDNTYYNGNVASNISVGESGDGQYIYMTGLLPLQNSYVISVAKGQQLPSLPKLMRDSLFYDTMITIPSKPDSWQQEKMDIVYGIDHLNSAWDKQVLSGYMTDSMTLDLAVEREATLNPPFFHLILTINMHAPYDSEEYVPNVKLDDSSPFPCNRKMETYLSKCIQTDYAIGKYVESLKDRGLFDNTVIVIASDHQAHSKYLDITENVEQFELLPLYIINSAIPRNSFYPGQINQIDVYPTIINMFGLETKKHGVSWDGLGYTLLNPNHQENSVNEQTWDMSNKIIRGHFWEQLDL